MAFPSVAASAVTNGSTSADPATIDLPAGITAGDLLVLLIRVTGVTLNTPAGWTVANGSSADASDDHTAVYYRQADGSEGSTLSFDFSGSGRFAAVSMRIIDAAAVATQAPEISAVTTGTSTTPDPASLSPTGGLKDYLWLWLGGWEGEQTSPPATPPTNYTTIDGANSGTAGSVTSNCQVYAAYRQVNQATHNPGSVTISVSDDWTAWTMAIHPAPAGSVTATPPTLALATSLFAPTIAHDIIVPVASLALATFAPTVRLGQIVVPSTLALTISAFAPIVQSGVIVPLATLALATFAPTVTASGGSPVTVTPTTAALTTAAFAPVIKWQINGAAPTALTTTSFAPVIKSGIVVPLATLSLATFAPQIKSQITVPLATLSLATFAPQIKSQIIVPPASLSLVTFAPQLNFQITVPLAMLTLGLFAPTVTVAPVAGGPVLVVPGPMTLVLTGFSGQVFQTVLEVAGNPLELPHLWAVGRRGGLRPR